MNTDSQIEGPSLVNKQRTSPRPSVYLYTDYRKFLAEAFLYLKSKNSSYSENAFIRQAGLASNSRGYLGLIIKGKRNLSAKTILGFSQSLKLNENEALYFENLVHFNQCQGPKEKQIYFDRLNKSIKGFSNKSYQLLQSQYRYLSNWYYIAIRELVSFSDFEENHEWIIKKLKNKLNKKQIEEAISDLVALQLLTRNSSGKLEQCDEVVEFVDNSLNHTVVNILHEQFLNLSKQSLEEDSYLNRSHSHVVLACPFSCFPEIRKEIADFRKMILDKYGHQKNNSDVLINLSFNMFSLTPIDKTFKGEKK